MQVEPGLLTLVQWLSPAFPVGGYAYSHGLETAITEGALCDAAGLEAWLRDLLRYGTPVVDAHLMHRALAGEALADLQEKAKALASSRERWDESFDQGRAFVAAVNPVAGLDLPPLALPLAVGAAARGLGLPPATVVAHYLQSFLSSLVSGAVRFVPLGQTEGQQVLAALAPEVTALAERSAAWDLDAIGTAAFGSDLAAMRHEAQEVRIFRS